MATAGAELAALVKTQIVANGANFVVVNNLPDIAVTPFALAQPASTQALIKAMVAAFNDPAESRHRRRTESAAGRPVRDHP